MSKELDSAAIETVTEIVAMLDGKGEKKEINELENGKHSTYHSK